MMTSLKRCYKRNRPRQGESQRLQILVRVNHNVFRSSSGRGESQCLQILQWNAANNIVFRSSSGMLEGCHRTKRSKSRKSYTNVFRSSSGMLEECNGQKDPNTENPTNLMDFEIF
ncbi:unnamed protein product [Rodentolepis nana]|uniref:Uncharacterized protein n=1 Tax=Rodentolepis nana TaxID=102285 RepID=A0A0R3TWI5_RODNA|nr:unnamed protein product [Rodentolepis nana]